MNKHRRNKIAAILAVLNELRAGIEALRDEEQGAVDNLPDGLQESGRAQVMADAVENLDEAVDGIDSVVAAMEAAQV